MKRYNLGACQLHTLTRIDKCQREDNWKVKDHTPWRTIYYAKWIYNARALISKEVQKSCFTGLRSALFDFEGLASKEACVWKSHLILMWKIVFNRCSIKRDRYGMEHFDHRFVTNSLNDLHYRLPAKYIRPWLNIATYHVRQECCLSTLRSNYTDRIIHKNAALLQTMYRYNQHHYDCLEMQMLTSVTPPAPTLVTFNE